MRDRKDMTNVFSITAFNCNLATAANVKKQIICIFTWCFFIYHFCKTLPSPTSCLEREEFSPLNLSIIELPIG